MKLWIIALLVFFSDAIHSQTPSSTIAFDERVYDFGTILEKNGKVSHSFVFHNKGKTPAAIGEVFSGCGCIANVTSNPTVRSGQKGKIIITFNPEYKSGFFSKEIVVYSNGKQNYNRIWVQGTIIPAEHPVTDDYPYNFGEGLYLRLKVMAFGYLKPGESRQMELHYANNTDKAMTLDFTAAAGLKFTSPGKIAPKTRGVVSFLYTMPWAGNGDIVFFVTPLVNNKKLAEKLEIKVLGSNISGSRK